MQILSPVVRKLSSGYRVYADGGLRAVGNRLRANVRGGVSALYPSTNVYERPWDVLVVLDGCRYDLFTEVAPDYDYVMDIDSLNSVASKTSEWLERTFTPEYSRAMERTVYVSGNPNTGSATVASADFLLLDNVWEYVWDDDLGTMPPRAITDRAITHYRRHRPDRMIVHYMQPHVPFVSHPDLDEGIPEARIDPPYHGANDNKMAWEKLRDGEVDRETVWEAYRSNLEHVMDDLAVLLDNLTADRVVLTSDHGNAMGEFGVYGHPRNTPISALRRVPWARVDAEDTGTYDPDDYDVDGDEGPSVEEQLQHLGYVA